MPLGCSTSLGRARGKGKATFAKRHKEIIDARGYTAFQGSALQSGPACSVSNADVNKTYYHDNALNAFPQAVDDKIYTSKRLNNKFLLTTENKFIKAGPNRGRYYSIQYK